MSTRKPLKVGVWAGAGPPPGYHWSVGILDMGHREALDLLDSPGRQHLSLQVRELAMQGDPTHSATISLDKIDEIYELRDKGGPLGPLNVRLFFGVDDANKWIIVLGIIKKQNNGKTPYGDKVRMCRRWRMYRQGQFGSLPSLRRP